MKKLKGSLAAKWIAAILFAATALTVVFTGAAEIYMVDAGMYSTNADEEKLITDTAGDWAMRNCGNIAHEIRWMNDELEVGAGREADAESYERLNELYPGFCFDLLDEDGKTVYDGLKGREALWTGGEYRIPFVIRYEAEPAEDGEALEPETADETKKEEAPSPQPTAALQTHAPESEHADQNAGDGEGDGAASYTAELEKEYRVIGHVLKDLPEDSQIYQRIGLVTAMYTYRTEILQAAVASFLASIALFFFLMRAAGHRNGVEGIRTGFTEKIPFDLFTAAIFCAEGIVLNIIFELGYGGISILLAAVFYAVGGAAFVLICLWWCMSFAVRIKTKMVIKSCLCYRVATWCWRLIKKCWGFIWEQLRGLPLIGKAAWIIAGILLVEFIYSFGICGGNAALAFGWFVERGALVLLTIYTLLCMKRLLSAGKEIAAGKLDYSVDTKHMVGPFKEHAESLNNITEGLNRAVGERMKSERFRTELITNVSHDIKTPLTSIINYVDLMEKEEPENAKMREYLEVLSRQSARLKKLIEDLMEASKASSGALNVDPERCELGVLIDQCAGEYAEKFEGKNLELIVDKPEKPVCIMADRRHMWRIFDNLLNNICKYAQSGTRVYIDLEQRESRASVTFRNISASRLNIPGDELMERFVRGDLSRNTEGSGLGLSIAQSLTKLQKGEMTLTIDGDLFKVELSFETEK